MCACISPPSRQHIMKCLTYLQILFLWMLAHGAGNHCYEKGRPSQRGHVRPSLYGWTVVSCHGRDQDCARSSGDAWHWFSLHHALWCIVHACRVIWIGLMHNKLSAEYIEQSDQVIRALAEQQSVSAKQRRKYCLQLARAAFVKLKGMHLLYSYTKSEHPCVAFRDGVVQDAVYKSINEDRRRYFINPVVLWLSNTFTDRAVHLRISRYLEKIDFISSQMQVVRHIREAK